MSGQSADGRQREAARRARIECLYLTCFQSDFFFLATVLQYSRIRLHRAETVEDADFLLTVSGCTVLLSDVVFLDGSWLDALQMVADLHPFVAALVVADPVDHPFLIDAYSRGACGVIWKPIDVSEAIHLIHAAHEASIDRSSLREGPVESAHC
jgi:DNA-binding NtrC family response regulator